jgi:DNA repair exonuclease SbcCD ATPase subunit
MERAAHQTLMEFCERHPPGLDGIAIDLLPVWNEGNAVWSERMAAVGDPELPTYHLGWAFMARYA